MVDRHSSQVLTVNVADYDADKNYVYVMECPYYHIDDDGKIVKQSYLDTVKEVSEYSFTDLGGNTVTPYIVEPYITKHTSIIVVPSNYRPDEKEIPKHLVVQPYHEMVDFAAKKIAPPPPNAEQMYQIQMAHGAARELMHKTPDTIYQKKLTFGNSIPDTLLLSGRLETRGRKTSTKKEPSKKQKDSKKKRKELSKKRKVPKKEKKAGRSRKKSMVEKPPLFSSWARQSKKERQRDRIKAIERELRKASSRSSGRYL